MRAARVPPHAFTNHKPAARGSRVPPYGNDGSAMIEDRLADPGLFDGAEYRRIAALPIGVERTRVARKSTAESP